MGKKARRKLYMKPYTSESFFHIVCLWVVCELKADNVISIIIIQFSAYAHINSSHNLKQISNETNSFYFCNFAMFIFATTDWSSDKLLKKVNRRSKQQKNTDINSHDH